MIFQGFLMSKLPDSLWLSTSPSLQCFDRLLLGCLAKDISIARWEYYQTEDEACSLNVAGELLHDYLLALDRPVHLIGHSTSGLLGLLYARQYPEKVKSLTLLGVGVHPGIDWQAHYYVHRRLLSRKATLKAMVYNLFGYHDECTIAKLVNILEQDLNCSLSPHSLFGHQSLLPGGVSVPLMICGCEDDTIVEPQILQGWQPWLKEGDFLWSCPQGGHFFHFFYPQQVGQSILGFWQSLQSDLRIFQHC
jgi:pimeloyl-ACP methyl ester carboxylesterase